MGKIIRRLVATMAKQVSKAPQYALSTTHILQCVTDVWRAEIRSSLLPDVSMGAHQHIFGKTRWAPPRSSSKGKEGGKGILSCPCFLHWVSIQHSQQHKRGFRMLNGCLPICRPGTVGAVFTILQQELQNHAHIHLGKTQVWNRGGVVPVGIEQLMRLARRVKPDAVVWRAYTDLRLSQGSGFWGSLLANLSAALVGEENPGTSNTLPMDSLVG